ncbi:MAG: HAMP domain-containing sensor histidine kinase [Clostridia bacterium]
MKKHEQRDNTNFKTKFPLIFYLTAFSFVVMVLSAILLYGIWYLADAFHWYNTAIIGLRVTILVLFLSSILVSSSIVRIYGNRFLFESMRALSRASKQVAAGDFSPRLPIPRERELGELTVNFNNMAEQLGRQEMLATDFISNVSHEFRNPLSAIRGYAQLLDSDALSSEQRHEFLAVIEEKALGLSTLVTNILELSRLENRGFGTDAETFSLDEQIRQCVLLSEQVWSRKNLEMDVSLAPVTYWGNKSLLMEVWQNLIDNAIKFTPSGGKITITLSDADSFVVVRIADTGIGMDSETAQRIFDKFYQGSSSQSGEGNGLGLSIVQKILSFYNGNTEVFSQPGRGTSMLVTLPRTVCAHQLHSI